jgi:hypothetical protein
MAKGGGKKRTYVRDGNGRFASTPGGAAKKAAKSTNGRASTLSARTGLKGSRAKLAAKDKADPSIRNTLSTRAQKGAVTRGSRKLATAKVAAQTRIGGARKGVIGMPKGLKNRQLAGRIDGPVKGVIGKSRGLRPGALAARGEAKPAASKLQPGKRIIIKTKRTPKPTKQDKAFESVMNLKGVADFSRGKQRQVWIDAKMMTLSRRKKLGLSGIRAESDRYYAREDINPTTRMPGYFMGTRSGWLNSQPKTRQGVIKRPRRTTSPSAAVRTKRFPLAKAKPLKSGANPKPTRTKGSRTILPRTPGTIAKPKGLKPSPVNKEAAKPMKAAVQFRSRKQAAKAYKLKTNTLGNKTAASIGFNAAIERRNAFADSAPRLVSRRGKNQQITLSGGVETVRTGKMKQVGERVKGGSIRRSKAKPGPIAGSRSWKKNVERQMKSGGVVDPWLKAAYERRYGKSR